MTKQLRTWKLLPAILFLLCFLSNTTGFAQGYTRKSLTILMMDFEDGKPIPSSYFSQLQVSDRHDYNNIGTKTIQPGIYFNNAASYSQEELNNKIYADRIPNRILESILIDPATRAMTVANVQERGLYNASDNDLALAQNAARGVDILKDAGLKLLSNVYFVIIKPTSYTSSYNAYSKGNDHVVSGVSYLYQLDLDSAYMSGKFWDDFYFDKPNPTLSDKLKNHKFPLKYTSNAFSVTVSDLDVANKVSSALQMFGNALANKQATADASTLTRKSQSEIYSELLQKVYSQSIAAMESGSDFLMKGSVFKSHPLLSKMGKKENVKTDQLFEVTENVLDEKTGKARERHVGFVRAKWVADNRQRSNGLSKPSSFYRVASGKISKGMQLKDYSAYDRNWTIGASYNTDSMSVLSGYYLNFEYMTRALPGLNVGVDLGYNPKLVTESLELAGDPDFGSLTAEALVGTLTLRQNFSYHRLVITPTFGALAAYSTLKSGAGFTVGGEDLTSSKISEDYKKVTAYIFGLVYGGDVGINLGRTLQLRAGVRFTSLMDITYNEADDAAYEFNDFTPTYKKQIFTFGIRFGRL